MRIAIFHNLPSGGAKRTLLEQTRRLAENHSIDVYTLTCANHDFADLRQFVSGHFTYVFEALPLLNSPFGRFNQAIRSIDLIRLEKAYKKMAIEIEKAGYDVLLVHPCQFEQAPGVANFVKGCPIVYYCHEPLRLLYEPMPYRPYHQGEMMHRQLLNLIDPLPVVYQSVLKRFDMRNTRAADLVLVNSNFTGAAVNRIYKVEAQVSYHGIDTMVFQPLEVSKKPMVLSVGSLTPLKGFDFLIGSIAQIAPDKRPTLTIASNFQNPPERLYLIDLATHLGVDLQLLTNINDEYLVELYNQAIVTVYAPINEPFGLVPLESMACGTPVVAVSEGGIKESVIHGETGLLVERDPLQFAGAVSQFLEDPTMITEFGRRGRDYVLESWSWECAVASLEHHLNTVACLQ